MEFAYNCQSTAQMPQINPTLGMDLSGIVLIYDFMIAAGMATVVRRDFSRGLVDALVIRSRHL